MPHRLTLSTVLFTSLSLALGPTPALARSADGAIAKMDKDGDGRLSRDEWRRKGMFNGIDSNSDGYLDRTELQVFFGEGDPDKAAPAASTRRDNAGDERPDAISMAAIQRSRSDDVQAQKDRGLFETGLHPVWPDDVECVGIDEWYAKDYTNKRPKESYHGGIDLPVPTGTPVHAAMAGEVIAVYPGERNPRGIEVVLRHTPEDSGLPLYLYSRYTHFDTLPTLRVGQRVAMGDVLGPTGNTGILGCEAKGTDCHGRSRRPAVHFDILWSTDPRYYDTGRIIVPFDAHWMDPNALYRKTPPFDSQTMKALPSADKAVAISYLLDNGETVPADTRMVWPYPCHKVDPNKPKATFGGGFLN